MPASSTGLRPRFCAMLPTTKSESMLKMNAMPTLIPASPSWPESRLAATAPTVALSGSDALDEDLRGREAARRARELARDDEVEARRAHLASVSYEIRQRAGHARGTLILT